ncbi:cationic amino acid transporter 4, vacuolar-like [Silene latifolia]|uniref:cationic amino acid transporter 4, vacuolar-like n=1 Tax=Silene latifolia TaxID=37657 RepID=UPI003D78505D
MVECGGNWLMGFRGLTRRKHVDSHNLHIHHQQLAKTLSLIDLVGIGVGTTIGAGIYILIGSVAREQTGPALAISFLIAGIAASLSGFCYAELSCRCPSAGSAYHYTYICIGEGAAWLIGWGLILEYAVGGSVVARGVTPNLALYFGGEANMPLFLARHTVFGVVVDPCASVLVIIATMLLCIGVKESSLAQTIVTLINVCALVFVIVAGGFLACKNGWVGYDLSKGFLPFGINGVLAGSATVFFSYIGFDSVTATAEEVKNPKQELPLAIGISLSLSCVLYMLVSFVIVGLVPYYGLDKDTPISSAFSDYGMEWAAFIITSGAVMALIASLMGSLLPQSRILMAMARDGLLPSLFADINERTHVPVKGSIATGILAAALAFAMDVSELAGMVSVATLLAFTTVAISVLIIRYIPPKMAPLQIFLGESSSARGHGYNVGGVEEDLTKGPFTLSEDEYQDLLPKKEPLRGTSSKKEASLDNQNQQRRRKYAAWFLLIILVGVCVLTAAASVESLLSSSRYTLCGIGAAIFMVGISGLSFIGQDRTSDGFGHSGGFTCPFVPFLPAACILLNTYLLVNLGGDTWIRVSVWLLLGALVYVFYGRKHSSLSNATYVPVTLTADVSSPPSSQP